MTTLGGYNYTPEIVDTIQNEVKNYLECDNILTEYISVMVRNNKTKEEMANDLSDFIGIDKAGEFAGWLWNYIPSYFESINKQKQINDTAMQQQQQQTAKKPPTQRLILNAVKQAAEDTKNVRVPMTEESLNDSHYDIDNNNNNNNNSNNSTYSNGKKDFIKKDKHNNNNNNRKNGNNSNNNNNNNNKQPNFTITMNDINTGSKKRKNINRDDDDEIDKSNTINDTTDDPANIPLDLVSPKKSKKERCSYWPLCRNAEACIYHHPTTQCLLFPNCTYGDKCLYIHPSIPCKFGINCTNVDCVYNHPQRPTAPVATPPAMNEIPCRNGFACPNKKTGCGFYHPPPACKFGTSCNMGKACPFGHGKPCLYGLNCVTPNCTFAHHSVDQPIPDCKFGKECTNPKCKFNHTEQREIDKSDMNTDHLSSTLPSTPPKEEPIQTDEIQEPIDV
ncbi:hypothetical protein ACTFIW_009210 [Dictyostelium discoideum]